MEAGLLSQGSFGPTGTILVRPGRAEAGKGLPRAGEQFGRYRLIRVLGGGGMGMVYEAEEVESSRLVALKVLAQALDSPEARKRFLREGQLAAAINHPNSVYVFGTEEVAGTPVISMELMAGGTLQDRVAASGPLPVAEAVDAVLQVIAGLEAAQQAGILHRDVKPSNCFVDGDGTVKVGDFGLSISTSVRAEASLTAAGSIMGTPAFSSPEQLRGEELTARSDIYAVGVTLYFLLTGRTPFQAANFVQLLAAVLEKQAESPSKWRKEIPTGLSSAILRCLEKDAGERFPNYAQLREALLPFGSSAPAAATLGKRFFAGFLDLSIAGGVAQLLESGIPLGWTPFYPLLLVYFTVAEGSGGASLGKRIFGLQVVSATPKALGFGRAFIRALIFLSTFFIFDLAVVLILWRFHAANHRAAGFLAVIALTIPLGLLFVIARRRNGWMAIHDLATRSRVAHKSAAPVRPPVSLAAEVPKAPRAEQVGPYHILESLGESGGSEVLLGYDARLLRKVWIRKVPDGTPPIPPALRRLSRPGRLRWLSGRRCQGDSWDAYEGLSGKPLLEVIAEKSDWRRVRFWLLDLAAELEATSQAEAPAPLKLQQVWITGQGRAKLLDFQAPALTPESAPGVPASSRAATVGFSTTFESALSGTDVEHCSPQGREHSEPRGPLAEKASDQPSPHEFLLQVAASALSGGSVEREVSSFSIPLPLHARAILESLRNGGELTNIVAELKSSLSRPATVSRARRLTMFLATLWAPIFLTVIVILADSAPRLRASAELAALQSCLSRLESLPSNSNAAEEREALEIYVAGRFASVITNPWAMAQGPTTEIERHEAAARQILSARGQPSPQQFEAAKALVETELPGIKPEPATGMRSANRETRWIWIIGLGAKYGVCTVILPCWIAALAFGGGVLLRAFGLAIVKRTGEPASRGRVLWRNFLASAPFVIAAFALRGQNRFAAALPLCAAIAVAVSSSLLRGRTLQDRLAGTDLVPR